MIKCMRCDELKKCSEFYTKRSGRNKGNSYTECKLCMNTRNIVRMARLKNQAVAYLGGKCIDCGYSKNVKALHFHHLDPSQKDFNISRYKNRDFEKIKIELDKCVLLCANCHSERHDLIWRASNSVNWKIYNQLLVDWSSVGRHPTLPSFCLDCRTFISYGSTRCKGCFSKFLLATAPTKIKWPATSYLISRAKEIGYSALGRELGVSDSAIRKRIKRHP